MVARVWLHLVQIVKALCHEVDDAAENGEELRDESEPLELLALAHTRFVRAHGASGAGDSSMKVRCNEGRTLSATC